MVKIIFRVDSSLLVGAGHVMRCLTLADALTETGAHCHFICRDHCGSLIEHIRDKGYRVYVLPVLDQAASLLPEYERRLAHAPWLGASWQQDVQACDAILKELRPDWLIVDHYALDARWETALKAHCGKLMVIDDLADREHHCDLLLDQTFGRKAEDYKPWVPAECTVLCGSQYALLRPDFAALRPYSLQRRDNQQLRRLLISMGGVDKDNATAQVLQALKTCDLPPGVRITVVMGRMAPWLAEIRCLAAQMPWATEVLVNVSNMAQLMADSDLAIGAAGGTSWERCCLGLPSIVLCLADNQREVISMLEKECVAVKLELNELLSQGGLILRSKLAQIHKNLPAFVEASALVTDGGGVNEVVFHLRVQL